MLAMLEAIRNPLLFPVREAEGASEAGSMYAMCAEVGTTQAP